MWRNAGLQGGSAGGIDDRRQYGIPVIDRFFLTAWIPEGHRYTG
ncbi:hypothetical protein ASZ90_011277 [hydrocarbon metagenome]|uniref:Uncharacterized protein n=1 Tax=hydrocarbon metagenome TaxID=938273 RepID=A0A0W8FDR0_9ZZZZ